MKKGRISLADFLIAFELQKDEILGQISNVPESRDSHTGDQQGTSYSLYATWELAFDEVVRKVGGSHDAPMFLSTLASFQDPIIFESVCRSYAQSSKDHPAWASSFIVDGQWDSGKYHDFAAKLAANSLVAIGFEGDDMMVSMHRVVQEWVRHRLPSPEQQRDAP